MSQISINLQIKHGMVGMHFDLNSFCHNITFSLFIVHKLSLRVTVKSSTSGITQKPCSCHISFVQNLLGFVEKDSMCEKAIMI